MLDLRLCPNLGLNSLTQEAIDIFPKCRYLLIPGAPDGCHKLFIRQLHALISIYPTADNNLFRPGTSTTTFLGSPPFAHDARATASFFLRRSSCRPGS